MKKILVLVMVLMLSVMAFAACGNAGSDEGSSDAVSVESLKTIGDIIALEEEGTEMQSSVYENHVVYAFKNGDTYYRAIASISDEDQQAYFDIDFAAEDYVDQQNAIVAPLEIESIENLSEQALPQEELDALAGKTGQELQDAGWTFQGYDLSNMEFWMNYGPLQYTVTFDGEVAESEYESFEAESGTKDMKVKSAVFSGLGDATNLDTDGE